MKDFAGKRLLILGGAGQTLKVIDAAHKMGVYTIVTDRAANIKVKEAADECLSFSVKDVEGITDWINKNKVDGILNFNIDASQTTHYELCTKYGFPCYGTKEHYDIFTNKVNFKRCCQQYGVDVIPQYTEDDVLNGQAVYPVVVKPADSSGSRGNTICSERSEALQAIENARKESYSNSVIIEKCMVNYPDFAVIYLVVNGEPHLVKATDRYLGRREDGLDRECNCGIAPSVFTNTYLEKVHPRVVNMLRGVGLKNAPIFMQGFIDGDTVRFYDPGIRFPASEFEDVLEKTLGIDLMKDAIRYALGGAFQTYDGRLAKAYQLDGKRLVQLLLMSASGHISSYVGLDEIRALLETVSVILKVPAGTDIPPSGDVKQWVAEVDMVVPDSPESICRAVNDVRKRFAILDENGRDLLVSFFDPDEMRY